MRKSGISLIEVLIVVAIISIVSALLMPVFSHVRASAIAKSCLSNMMQLTKAQMLYSSDNSGSFATLYNGNLLTGYWLDQLQPYVKSQDGLICPINNRRHEPVFQWKSTGFALNGCLLQESQASESARIVLFTEITEVTSFQGGSATPLRKVTLVQPDVFELRALFESGNNQLIYAVTKPYGSQRHRNGGHYAMTDGHAEWSKPDSIWRPDSYYSCENLPNRTWVGRQGGLTFLVN